MRLSTRITLHLIELRCNISTFMVFILGKLNNRLDSKEIANVWLMFEHHNKKKKYRRILQFCHSHAFVSTLYNKATRNLRRLLQLCHSHAFVSTFMTNRQKILEKC